MGVLTRFVGCGGVELICNISVAQILDSTFIAQYYFLLEQMGGTCSLKRQHLILNNQEGQKEGAKTLHLNMRSFCYQIRRSLGAPLLTPFSPMKFFCMNTTGLCMHRIYALTQILTASIEATSHPGKYVTEKTTP